MKPRKQLFIVENDSGTPLISRALQHLNDTFIIHRVDKIQKAIEPLHNTPSVLVADYDAIDTGDFSTFIEAYNMSASFPLVILTSGNDDLPFPDTWNGNAKVTRLVKSPDIYDRLPEIIVRDVSEWQRQIEREQFQSVLAFISQRSKQLQGISFLQALVKHLSETLDIAYVLVSHYEADLSEDVSAIAVAIDGEIAEGFRYDLRGTPCETVYDKAICCYPQNIQNLFPLDVTLIEMGAQGYAGTPLWDRNGQPIGLIVFITREPIDSPGHIDDLLRISAVRACHELESMRDEKRIKVSESNLIASEARWRSLAENIPNILIEADLEGNIEFVNFLVMSDLSPEEVVGTSFYDYTPIIEHDRVKGYVNQVVQTGETISYEILGINERWYSVCIGSIKQDNQVVKLLLILTDITHIKQAAIVLRESENRLQLAMKIAKLGIWDWEIATDKIWWFGEMFNIYGITAEEFTGSGQDYIQFTREDYRAQQLTNIEKAFASGLTERQLQEGIQPPHNPKELCIVRPDGSEVYTLGDAISIIDEDGNPLRMLGITMDVTESKQSERALKESVRQYQAITTTAMDGFWIVGQNGQILDVNDAYCDMIGYTRDELLQMNISDIEAKEAPEETEKHIQIVIQEKHDRFESRHRHKDGEIIDVEVSTFYMNESAHFVSFIRDITQLKQQQKISQARLYLGDYAFGHSIDELLRETLDYAEKLTASGIGFLHFVDADQETLTLQQWSSNTLNTMCKVEGKNLHYAISDAGVWVDCVYKREPVVHNDYKALTHKKGLPEGHAPVIRELVVPVIRNEQIVAILGVGNKLEDYTRRDVEIVQQLANTGWDIIAAKKAKFELRKRDEVIALKDRFITTVSHEFRTPLAIIQSSSQLLSRYGDRLTVERREKSFRQIYEQIAHLTELINGVLLISKKDSGRIEFSPTLLKVELFCRNVYDRIKFADSDKHQFVFISNPPSGEVMVDKTILQHILNNLLDNAVKFSPEGSTIKFTLNHDDTSLIIEIQDEGIGIPDADKVHLFESFYRASNALNLEGTGLGLSIVKEYLELHDGQIEFESRVDEGSTFRVILPIAL